MEHKLIHYYTLFISINYLDMRLVKLILADVFSKDNYLAAYEKVKQQEVIVNTMIMQLIIKRTYET